MARKRRKLDIKNPCKRVVFALLTLCMRAMDAPVRMTSEERGEGFEREGEIHMNENSRNRPGSC